MEMKWNFRYKLEVGTKQNGRTETGRDELTGYRIGIIHTESVLKSNVIQLPCLIPHA